MGGLIQVTLEHIILNIYSKPGGNSQILNSLEGLSQGNGCSNSEIIYYSGLSKWVNVMIRQDSQCGREN